MSDKKFLKGAFILASGGLMAKFLGIFFKIPLQRLIHDEGMGLFGLPYPIYTVLLSISIIGLPAAVSKLISEKLALGDLAGANKVFKVSFVMLFCIGIFTSAFLYFGANIIIQLLNWPQEAYYSIVGMSFAPFFVSIMSAFRGYFQGMQFMLPTALSQIIEQSGRVIVGVLLAYMLVDRGIGCAAGGASFGATAGAFMGATLLFLFFLKQRKRFSSMYIVKAKGRVDGSWAIIKKITWLAIPITIGAVLSSIMGLIDSIIVPARLLQNGYTVEGATILYGRLTGKAVTLVNVPLTFSMAMAASLVPAISQSFSQKNLYDLREKAAAGIKTTVMIALPAAIGLSLLAPQIIHLLWGKNEAGGDILQVLAVNVLFISLAQTLSSTLQGIDKVVVPVRSLIVGAAIKAIISYILLGTYLNIIGTVIGSVAGYIVIMLLNYIVLKRSIGLKISIKDTVIKPLTASMVMMGSVTFVFKFLYSKTGIENVATLLAILAGIISYFLCLYIVGGIEYKKGKLIFW